MHRATLAPLLLLLLLAAACGDALTSAPSGVDAGGADANLAQTMPPDASAADTGGDPCAEDILGASPLRGRVFVDLDADTLSRHLIGYAPSVDVPVERPVVELLRPDGGPRLRARSCADGRYGFDAATLAPGDYLRALPEAVERPGQVASSNQAYRLPRALQEGSVQVVSIGDSVPRVGPQPWFSARLSARLEAFGATVEDQNVAVPGSRSNEWLPGTAYFEDWLGPLLPEADVVLISLGGNDFFQLADQSPKEQPDLVALQREFEAAVAQVLENIDVIVSELRRRAPQADLVWVLYPNYASSGIWETRVGKDYIGLVNFLLVRTLRQVRAKLVRNRVLVVDMLEATRDEELDPLLFDEVHLSAAGHARYADEIFWTLGGVALQEGAAVVGDVALRP